MQRMCPWSPVSPLHFTQQTDHKKRAGHEVEGAALPCNVTHGHDADSIESVSQLSSKTCRVRGVTYTNMMKLRAKSKRLTDAFTKLLMPGTSTREISACACNRNRVLEIERFCVASHSSKVPKRMKQSGSSPEDRRFTCARIQ